MREIVYHNGTVLVDDEDYDYVMTRVWHVNVLKHTSYAIRLENVNGKYQNLSLHRFILGDLIIVGMVIDHINHNGLDNRRSNLRICTRKQNTRNRLKHKDATGSQYIGVSLNKVVNRYFARIVVNGKCKHLGMFGSEVEAAVAYNKAAKKYFGEYANLNILI